MDPGSLPPTQSLIAEPSLARSQLSPESWLPLFLFSDSMTQALRPSTSQPANSSTLPITYSLCRAQPGRWAAELPSVHSVRGPVLLFSPLLGSSCWYMLGVLLSTRRLYLSGEHAGRERAVRLVFLRMYHPWKGSSSRVTYCSFLWP